MDMTTLESICVYVYEDGDVSLKKIIHNKQPRPFGIYYSLSEITDGSLNKELINYGCDLSEITEAIDAVLKAPLYEEIIVGKV